MAGVLGLFQHARVEREPRQLAIDEPLRARISVGVFCAVAARAFLRAASPSVNRLRPTLEPIGLRLFKAPARRSASATGLAPLTSSASSAAANWCAAAKVRGSRRARYRAASSLNWMNCSRQMRRKTTSISASSGSPSRATAKEASRERKVGGLNRPLRRASAAPTSSTAPPPCGPDRAPARAWPRRAPPSASSMRSRPPDSRKMAAASSGAARG